MARAQAIFVTAALLAWPVAPAAADAGLQVETLARGLEHPWSLAFLPDGTLLVTERAGRLRTIVDGQLQAEPIAGVPPPYVASQGGLFEVLPAPDFAASGRLYLSFASGDRRRNATRVISATLRDGALHDLAEVFTAHPWKATPVHYGGRMTFLPDGTLLLTVGDGFDLRERAQHTGDHLGSVVRLLPDGSPPGDNPLAGDSAAAAGLYAWGLRNPQGLAVDPATGDVWLHDHGPRGGDTLQRLRAGLNYGWPLITRGIDYAGALVSPFTSMQGMEPPLHHWTPSIAPSGLAVYRGTLFPQWDGDLFVGALAGRALHRLRVRGGAVVEEQRLLTELGERIRDVRVGPDGALYLLTDSGDGRLLRVTPGPP